VLGKIVHPLDAMVKELPKEEKDNKLYLPDSD